MRATLGSLALLTVLAACAAEHGTAVDPVAWLERAAASPELFADWRGVGPIALSPDGRDVAWLEEEPAETSFRTVYALKVAPIGAGIVVERERARRFMSALPLHSRPVWSAEGELAWSVARKEVQPHQLELFTCAHDGEPSRLLRLAAGSDLYASAPAWSPDGALLAVVAKLGATERLLVVDRGGAVVVNADLGAGSFFHLPHASWSPDGKRIAIDQESGASLFDVAGRRLHRFAGSDEPRTESAWTPPQWSADGARVAFTFQCRVFVASVPSLAVTSFTPLPARRPFAPDEASQEEQGRFVAAAWIPGTDRLFLVQRRHQADRARDLVRILSLQDCFDLGNTWWFGFVAAPCDPDAPAPAIVFQDPPLFPLESAATRSAPWRARPWTTRLMPQLAR